MSVETTIAYILAGILIILAGLCLSSGLANFIDRKRGRSIQYFLMTTSAFLLAIMLVT